MHYALIIIKVIIVKVIKDYNQRFTSFSRHYFINRFIIQLFDVLCLTRL